MYIAANLPAFYGQFNQIQKDNYPFRKAFGKYLEAFARLGLALGLDADMLTGAIEDKLFEGRRLPDMEEGTEPVKFRFPLENGAVDEYFKSSELTNKAIILHVIRLTVRLSAEFGTSLPRLTRMLEKLMPKDAPDVDNVDNFVDNSMPSVRIVKVPPKETQKATQKETQEVAAAPAETAHEPAPPEKTQEETHGDALATQDMVQEKLSGLVEKAGQLIKNQKEEPEKQEDAGIPVVETNPLLANFL